MNSNYSSGYLKPISNNNNAKLNESVLIELSKQEHNSRCCDCGKSSPRWASYNIGCFICIRCSGLHRKMGTHISKVKSITLDKWTDEQVENMKINGNLKVNQRYLTRSNIPQTPSDINQLEDYIRNKYERMRFCERSVAMEEINKNKNHYNLNNRNYYETSYSNNESYESSRSMSDTKKYCLEQLQSMGFKDNNLIIRVLDECQNDIKAAIEILCRTPTTNTMLPYETNHMNRKNSNSNSKIRISLNSEMSRKLEQLENMGFTNKELNSDILHKTRMDLDKAVDYLINNTSNTITTDVELVNNKEKQNNNFNLLDDFENFGLSSKMHSNDIDKIKKDYNSENINKSNTKHSKNDIMSLFDSKSKDASNSDTFQSYSNKQNDEDNDDEDFGEYVTVDNDKPNDISNIFDTQSFYQKEKNLILNKDTISIPKKATSPLDDLDPFAAFGNTNNKSSNSNNQNKTGAKSKHNDKGYQKDLNGKSNDNLLDLL